MHFKIVRLMAIRTRPKWTIFTSGGFGLLQMVSESDTKWCASENVGKIPHRWRRERNILYKGVETSPVHSL